jgi:hypothetical protein
MSFLERIPTLARLVEMLGFYRPPEWVTQHRADRQQVLYLTERGIGYYGYVPTLTYALVADIVRQGVLPPHLGYRYFVKRRKDGRARPLAEPNAALKAIQHDILQHYLEDARLAHPTAMGYRRKRSIADHAWTHAGASTVIVCDLADFFPSTAAWRVEAWWKTRPIRANHYKPEPMSEAFAHVLTLLTTDQGGLPQGAPTSPALSNVVNYPLDVALSRKAAQAGAVYSRYVDDIVFSWADDVEPASDFEEAVRAVLRTYGYRINQEKGWRVYRRGDEPTITGVTLKRGGGVTIPQAMQQQIRLLERDRTGNEARLAGYYGYRDMVETPRKPTGRR